MIQLEIQMLLYIFVWYMFQHEGVHIFELGRFWKLTSQWPLRRGVVQCFKSQIWKRRLFWKSQGNLTSSKVNTFADQGQGKHEWISECQKGKSMLTYSHKFKSARSKLRSLHRLYRNIVKVSQVEVHKTRGFLFNINSCQIFQIKATPCTLERCARSNHRRSDRPCTASND